MIGLYYESIFWLSEVKNIAVPFQWNKNAIFSEYFQMSVRTKKMFLLCIWFQLVFQCSDSMAFSEIFHYFQYEYWSGIGWHLWLSLKEEKKKPRNSDRCNQLHGSLTRYLPRLFRSFHCHRINWHKHRICRLWIPQLSPD